MPLNVATVARDLAPLALALGIAFTVFGICGVVAVNIAHWREIRDDEEERLSDLSGRKRFERRKKKYKRIRTAEAKPSPLRPLGILPPPRPR